MKGMKNSPKMMKRLLKLKEDEDYTLDLNETDESNTEPVEVNKPVEVAGWLQQWNTSLQTFTKNLFLQTLQQYIAYKKGAALSPETIEGIKTIAKGYGLESEVNDLLNKSPQPKPESNEQPASNGQPLKESESGNTNNENQNTDNQPSQENESSKGDGQTNQPNENQSNENKSNEGQSNQETVSDEVAMKEVLENLPALVQSNLPTLVGNIEGVNVESIPTPEESSAITDMESLKNYLSNINDVKDLQSAFGVFEEKINAIEPKPVDAEKMAKVKDHFKLKDDYLGDIEKVWQKYMQAVNNNSATSELVELKNLLNVVHNFNRGSSIPEPEESKASESTDDAGKDNGSNKTNETEGQS